ncbi:recombination regulator RecX [Candidatus Nanopelagicales bacterium]|jgi:regulatory protein|nr:recombination regulator RecX [Candidatus Nanopelagicales bacterium]
MSPRRPEPPTDQPLEDSADPETAVRSILLRRLSHAPRTRAELEKDLARRGADPEVSAQVLDRFEEVGLIDDASYARLWVESRHRGKALARSVLKQELRQRGVDPESIDVAIEQIDDDAEYQRAREFASRKARVKPGEDSAKALSRLAGQLARKGYPAGVCFSVAKEVLGPLLEERQDHVVDEVDAGVVVDHFAEHQESV